MYKIADVNVECPDLFGSYESAILHAKGTIMQKCSEILDGVTNDFYSDIRYDDSNMCSGCPYNKFSGLACDNPNFDCPGQHAVNLPIFCRILSVDTKDVIMSVKNDRINLRILIEVEKITFNRRKYRDAKGNYHKFPDPKMQFTCYSYTLNKMVTEPLKFI